MNQIIKRIRSVQADGRSTVPYFTIFTITILSFADCQKDTKDNKVNLSLFLLGQFNTPVLSTRLMDSAFIQRSHNVFSSSKLASSTHPVSNSLLQGVYFGELEIFAYDHRPGEADQEGNFGSGKDWSHWAVAPSGYEESRNNILKAGEQINPNWYHSERRQRLSERDFEIDAFEIAMFNTGIVYNNEYYGEYIYNFGEDTDIEVDPLTKYPEWKGIPKHRVWPTFTGFTSPYNIVSVIFIRNDILTSAANVEIQWNQQNTIPSIGNTSRSLSAEESNFILSLVEQGTRRRHYLNLVLVPYEGPFTFTFNGESDEAKKRYAWQDYEIAVSFDLSNGIDTDPNKTDLNIPKILFAADSRNVPLGLKMDLRRKE
ncbi:hypothetical protein JWG45_07425 [Leptospira sp. 201903070]|uniref:Uncharacterized protein n=1 Tax=Leptospira ainlahdjerensis TaxID=2810033 RepID=A0ABS2U9E3_9LEPT|nr:hypothetical protein [Leptospira ainlahdjerensis]MBM9576982.1 hypothetical protein [Leptospira ainlahdjerensis]